MKRLLAWWRRLPGSQQALIGVGAPVAVIAAVWSNLRQRRAGAAGAQPTTVAGLAPGQAVSTVGTGDLTSIQGLMDAIFGLDVRGQEQTQSLRDALFALEQRVGAGGAFGGSTAFGGALPVSIQQPVSAAYFGPTQYEVPALIGGVPLSSLSPTMQTQVQQAAATGIDPTRLFVSQTVVEPAPSLKVTYTAQPTTLAAPLTLAKPLTNFQATTAANITRILANPDWYRADQVAAAQRGDPIPA